MRCGFCLLHRSNRPRKTPLPLCQTTPHSLIHTCVSYFHTYLFTNVGIDIRVGLPRLCTVREYTHNDIKRVVRVRVRDASTYIMIHGYIYTCACVAAVLVRASGVRDISVFMCPMGHGEKPSNGLRGTRARRRCMSVLSLTSLDVCIAYVPMVLRSGVRTHLEPP